MHIAKARINGNPNVGLFGFATKTCILFGERVHRDERKLFEDVLGLPLVRFSIAGTGIPGVFLVGNSRMTLVPDTISEHEQGILKERDVPFLVFTTRHNCLGNNIVCNDAGAIVSTDYSEKEVETIGKALGVPVHRMKIAGLTTPGAVLIVHGRRAAIHKDATPEEIAMVESILNVACEPATINLGSPYLHSGVLLSTHGLLVGDLSGGPEIVHLDETLGYHALQDE